MRIPYFLLNTVQIILSKQNCLVYLVLSVEDNKMNLKRFAEMVDYTSLKSIFLCYSLCNPSKRLIIRFAKFL